MIDLYRHFSASGELLYVGISKSAIERLQGHCRAKWVSEIARVEIEHFPNRRAALTAELLAIRNEGPLHNIAGNRARRGRTDARPSIYPELNRLRDYLNGLMPEEQVEFAARCGTTVGNLRGAVSMDRRFSWRLALRLTKESGGAFNVQRLFPELGLADASQALLPIPA